MANHDATAKAAAPESVEPKGPGRSASYPWIDLKSAHERASEFWKEETRYEAPLSSAFKHWGYGPKSSGARLTVAAMLNYGLMTDRGSNENRMVKLSPLGVDLMMGPTDGDKLKSLKIAAQKPRVFAELLRTMDPANLPSDQTIAHYLVTQKGFNPNATGTFIKNFRATIKYAQLKKSDILSAGGPSTTPAPATSGVTVGAWVQWESGGVLQFEQPRRVARVSEDGQFVFVEGNAPGIPVAEVTVVDAPAASVSVLPGTQPASAPPMPGIQQDTYTLGKNEGRVILQWPEKMTQASYYEFVEWIDLQLRKIARVNDLETKKK